MVSTGSNLPPMQMNLIEVEEDAFVKRAADELEERVSAALSKNGRCMLGLSGGATPLPVYQALATRPLEWSSVSVFLVDERFVAPDHPDSNLRAIKEALLDPLGIPLDRVLAPDTRLPLAECVSTYDAQLRGLLASGAPDIVTLGMGEDGHIASLFPPLSRDAFEGPLAIATHTDQFPVADRITVTLPLLLQVESPLIFLSGRTKRRTWLKMTKGEPDPIHWPLQSLLTTGRCTVVASW